MRYIGRILLIAAAVVSGMALSAVADDIALLELSSDRDVASARQILGHAYGKVGEKFIVEASDVDAERLAKAGLEIDVVMPNANAASVSVVLEPPDPAYAAGVRIEELGRVVSIGEGMHLGIIAPVGARAISAAGRYKVIPLDRREIPFHYNPPVVAAPGFSPMDFPTDSLVNYVDMDSLQAMNERLEAFYTRYIWTDSIDRARDWMMDKFTSWGYTDVTAPPFFWGGGTHYNVQAVKTGMAEPEKVIVVGGHYDAVTYNQPLPPDIYAPGADDNASGTVLSLELARVLKDVPLRKTVIFMPFSAEEVGLVGSEAAAEAFYNAGTDIEVMYNADMIGFTGTDESNQVKVQAGTMDVYQQMTVAAGLRTTTLTPVAQPPSGNSDHASFLNFGYPVAYAHEWNFNTLGWHTTQDISSRMDFPYMTEVIKMVLASVVQVAQSPSPSTVEPIVDVGDGQSLEINWSDCYTDNQYIIYLGTESGTYTDSIIVGPGACSYVWNGLVEGQTYHFLVIGISPTGYQAAFGVEGSEQPLSVPRTPTAVQAFSDTASLLVTWDANTEADFSHYRVYRRIGDVGQFTLHQDLVTEATFTDTEVMGQIPYTYQITAVDFDGNESGVSAMVTGYVSTFDSGPGIVDAFQAENQYLPSESEQQAYFDTLMNGNPYGVTQLEPGGDTLRQGDIGRFSTVIWIDDDTNDKTIAGSEATLEWYADYPTNILVSGFQTIQFWSSSPIPFGHMLRDEFGVTAYDYWGSPDFIGGHGQNGWPTVWIDPDRGINEWSNIPVLDTVPGATVILTYNSILDSLGIDPDPEFEGRPVGIAYETINGKRILLSFPMYYLTIPSAQALMAKALDYFGETNTPATGGDVDQSGFVDIGDLTMLIDYLFVSNTEPGDLNMADADGNCVVDVGDITLLINYLFFDGPAPVPGCVIP